MKTKVSKAVGILAIVVLFSALLPVSHVGQAQVDLTPPTVLSVLAASPNPTSEVSVDYTVKFSEPVTGVDLTDFSLTATGQQVLLRGCAATLLSYSGSGDEYTVTVSTGYGDGTFRLDVLDDNTILDLALNPLDGGYTSGDVYTFIRLAPVPVAAGLSVPQKLAGKPGFTLAIFGSKFESNAVVRWNGVDHATTYVGRGKLTTNVSAAELATGSLTSVTIFNPGPGGGLSNPLTFTVNNPIPVVNSLYPASKNAGRPAFTMVVYGTGFTGSSVVRFNGSDRVTTFVSSTKLRVAVLAADIASSGIKSITVFNPTPAGGLSNATSFVVH
jgi:hypothetical protein